MGEKNRRKNSDPTWGRASVAPSSTALTYPASRQISSTARPTEPVSRQKEDAVYIEPPSEKLDLPKNGRGLIVSVPIEIEGDRATIHTNELDRQDLRLSLLFWDKLVWPKSTYITIESNEEAKYLEDQGLLVRPAIGMIPGDQAAAMVKAQLLAFDQVEQRNPGKWAIAQGPNSLFVKEGILEEGRGVMVDLHRAIPVPDQDVPFDDILCFRLKRNDELLQVRSVVEDLYSVVINSNDSAADLAKAVSNIDTGCAALLRTMSEAGVKYRLSTLKSYFEGELGPWLAAGAGVALAAGNELNLTTAVLTTMSTAGGLLKIKQGLGRKKKVISESPYRYVAHYHDEVFNAR